MSFAIAAVDRKKYIAKRESREARRNPEDVVVLAVVLAVVLGADVETILMIIDFIHNCYSLYIKNF